MEPLRLKVNRVKGSSFSFRLPLEVANDQPEIQLQPKPLLKKVLVVDDNITNLHLMEETLGYFQIYCETLHQWPGCTVEN